MFPALDWRHRKRFLARVKKALGRSDCRALRV
jgi:hypothetical protein